MHVAATLDDLYKSALTLAPRHNVLGARVPQHSRWPVHFIGHKDADSDVLFFGGQATLDPLLRRAARAAGVDYATNGQSVLTPACYPGGYTALLFDPAV